MSLGFLNCSGLASTVPTVTQAGRIQELKGGGAEVKYLQRENFTLRHSHFGVIWL